MRSVILPKIKKGSFSAAFFDSIRNGLIFTTDNTRTQLIQE